MRTGFGVNGDDVAAGFGEGCEIGIGRGDHQVAVEHLVGAVADCLDDGRAEGDVGHEMAIHHIEVDPVSACFGDGFDFLAKAREIRSENGRGDERVARGHGGFPE